ncbi:MAG TPA: 1,4-dihydroxy-2-naphthoate polyprenyltransferase [Bacillota bacterium]
MPETSLQPDAMGRPGAEGATRPSTLALWWRVARPFSLTASIAPILVGGALAAYHGAFRPLLFAEMLLASILIQAGTNMVNEYYDYVKGLDTPESLGIGGVIVHGYLPARSVLRAGLLLFAVATAIGLHIAWQAGWVIFAVGLVCIAAAYVYTGGPWPVAYTPFGELEVFIFMGLVMVGLGYAVHTGTLTAAVVAAALPVSCIVAAILLANNIRDREEDGAKGRRTLAVLYGKPFAVGLYRALLVTAYAALPAAVVLDWLPWPALLPLLTIADARAAIAILTRQHEPRTLAPAVPLTARLHGRFGLLLAAGLALAALA